MTNQKKIKRNFTLKLKLGSNCHALASLAGSKQNRSKGRKSRTQAR